MRNAPSRWRGRRKRPLDLPTGVSSDRVNDPARAQHLGDSITFACLLLFLFVIYNLNLRKIGWDDTYPTRFLPFSLLLDHSVYLDQWIQPRLARPLGVHGIYFAARSHGHWVSAYPIITPGMSRRPSSTRIAHRSRHSTQCERREGYKEPLRRIQVTVC